MDLDTIFQEHYGRLVAWCSRHVARQLGDPEEFVHQAYCRCRKHWSARCSTPGREPAYFYRALRWVLCDAARRHQRQRVTLGRYPRPRFDPGDSTRTVETIAAEAFQALTPRERAICWRCLQGFTRQRVCLDLGLTLSALAVHLSRARCKLMQELGIRSQGRRLAGVADWPGPGKTPEAAPGCVWR